MPTHMLIMSMHVEASNTKRSHRGHPASGERKKWETKQMKEEDGRVLFKFYLSNAGMPAIARA